MAFIPAKCTQCGANITVDNSKDAGICEFCGTAFITEKAINNYTTNITNNFAGAHVTINNDSNIEGLLVLAKRELLAKYYRSNDLYKYLDEIVAKSPDGLVKIKNLFHEVGLYKIAESVVESGEKIDKSLEIANLLTKYDSENILGWLMNWRTSFAVKHVEVGENIIRLSDDSNKAIYEEEVYSYFLNHGPRCLAYKKYLGAIPQKYIDDNKHVQDTLIEEIQKIVNDAARLNQGRVEGERKQKISFIKGLLPKNRIEEAENIKATVPSANTKSGCYIATCVYGSYDCPQVWTLRRFRDEVLDTTWYGRAFIHTYYAISPTIVKWFGNQSWFKALWKKRLDNMINTLNEKGFLDTPYHDKY